MHWRAEDIPDCTTHGPHEFERVKVEQPSEWSPFLMACGICTLVVDPFTEETVGPMDLGEVTSGALLAELRNRGHALLELPEGFDDLDAEERQEAIDRRLAKLKALHGPEPRETTVKWPETPVADDVDENPDVERAAKAAESIQRVEPEDLPTPEEMMAASESFPDLDAEREGRFGPREECDPVKVPTVLPTDDTLKMVEGEIQPYTMNVML